MTDFHYAVLDEQGRVSSLMTTATDFAGDVLLNLRAVPSTREQFVQMEANPLHWSFTGGVFQELGPPLQALATTKTWALLRIDVAAEQARQQFLTPGAGQAMEYEQTQQNATRAMAASAAGQTLLASDYPWLEAELQAIAASGAAAPTLLEVAQSVIGILDEWAIGGAEIKRVRRTAKLAVDQAATAAAIATIVDGLTWPMPQ